MANNFDKFTERARKVLSLAQEEAQRFNHPYIGTEHLLLGLVREGEGVAARVLTNMGVQLPKVRSAVEFIIGRGEEPIVGEIGLSPRAKKVITLAVDEARRLDHSYIGTEHLLLGLVREGEGIAAGVLESLGISLEKVRQQILRALEGDSIRREPPGVLATRSDGPVENRRETTDGIAANLEAARLAGDQERIDRLELTLARRTVRELDAKEQQLFARLVAFEHRRLEMDTTIRAILDEIEFVRAARRNAAEARARAAQQRHRIKKGDVEVERDDPEDRR